MNLGEGNATRQPQQAVPESRIYHRKHTMRDIPWIRPVVRSFTFRPRIFATAVLLLAATTLFFTRNPFPVAQQEQQEQYFQVQVGENFANVASKTMLLSAAEAILDKHEVVAIQLLNEGYVPLTQSWICNAKHFPGVIERTLFIATDRPAYVALTRWDATLNVVHIDYQAPKDMSYGQYAYYAFMLFRTRLICYLLASNFTLWLIESDAVWLRDPSEEVFTTKGDMLTMSDRRPPALSLQGGFQLLRPSNATVNVWSKLAKQFEATMVRFSAGDYLGDSGNEQIMMDTLIRAEPDLHFAWLDPKHFLCGLYYKDPDYAATADEPMVILNNYIVGNSAKIERAKQQGHWFLKENGKCDAKAAEILVVRS